MSLVLKDFLEEFRRSIDNFEVNATKLSLDLEEKSQEEWMEILLRYLEWRTDMHKHYWNSV